MSNRYLLTCRCGETVPVEPKHAGSQIECECGATLDVPSMMELRKLPRETQTDARPQLAWGLPHSVALAGGLILVISVLLAVGVNYFRPERFMQRIATPEEFSQNVKNAPLVITWQIANKMRKTGLDEQTAMPELVDREIDKAYSAYNIGIGVLGAVGLVILAAGGFLFVTQSRSSLSARKR